MTKQERLQLLNDLACVYMPWSTGNSARSSAWIVLNYIAMNEPLDRVSINSLALIKTIKKEQPELWARLEIYCEEHKNQDPTYPNKLTISAPVL